MTSPASAAVARKEGVSDALLREAEQYRTVQTLRTWPVVTNTSAAVLDGYYTLKEGDVARPVLNVSEEVVGAVCRLAVLPVVTSPVVKTPLRMADWVGALGAELLQKAVPRLTDTKQPLRLNAELLLSLLMVPLTLSVALSRDLLELGVLKLVTTFPGLQPAAKGFAEKSLLAQCGTALLLLWVYLPLLLLSRPVETVRALVSVPGQAVAAVISWAREAASAVADELAAWASAVADLAVQAVSWVAATAQTAYYVLFVMTGLEPLLAALLERARALLATSREAGANLVSTVRASAPGSGLVRRMLSWRRSSGRGSSGAAEPTVSAQKGSSAVPAPALAAPAGRQTAEPELWAPGRIGGALLVTVSLCGVAVAVISLW
ncbi:uncharacterized protein LOC122393768 isoform X2 [Amphibalanus amphitrite]|uniref:uncharacterized protein LOC122393768 isoform X2 n=1 Tax=Amphibalanus amphitrite TaxID=1232801 RepID=UPI001C909185|nr:uncharacterized protein LOC122393768 isoform X2 [Amphibalanus amphitrite]